MNYYLCLLRVLGYTSKINISTMFTGTVLLQTSQKVDISTGTSIRLTRPTLAIHGLLETELTGCDSVINCVFYVKTRNCWTIVWP